MTAKHAKPSRKGPAGAARSSAPRRPTRKAANGKPPIKDPVGRYMHDHWGALGKDYKLKY